MPIDEVDGVTVISGDVRFTGDVVFDGNVTFERYVRWNSHRGDELFGYMEYGHEGRKNELTLVGFGDPPKVRLGAQGDISGTSLGAISGNHVRPDGTNDEVFLMQFRPKDDERDSLAGEMTIAIRDARIGDADKAMVSMFAISGAYTDDNRAVVSIREAGGNRIFNTYPQHDQSPEPLVLGDTPPGTGGDGTPAPTPAPGLQTENLRRAEGSPWWEAVEVQKDTLFRTTFAQLGATEVEIRLRLAPFATGELPYTYITIDDFNALDWRVSDTGGEYRTLLLDPSRDTHTIEIKTSAQNAGTVEVHDIIVR